MAKIGTAHVEIKPVLSEDAMTELMQRIEDGVAEAVRRGMSKQLLLQALNANNSGRLNTFESGG